MAERGCEAAGTMASVVGKQRKGCGCGVQLSSFSTCLCIRSMSPGHTTLPSALRLALSSLVKPPWKHLDMHIARCASYVILKSIELAMKISHRSYIVRTFSAPPTTTAAAAITKPFKWFRNNPKHPTTHIKNRSVHRYLMKMLGGCVIPVGVAQSKQLLFLGCTQLRTEFSSCESQLHLVSYIDLERWPWNITQNFLLPGGGGMRL